MMTTTQEQPGTTVSSISDSDREQVKRANATTKTPVVFIHGLWLLPSSWDAGPRSSRRPGTSR
jgi:hypothetical protein